MLYLGVFITTTILLGALTFDFSRLANLKAELQNSADAGAHAGATYIVHHGCPNMIEYAFIIAQATAYAQFNLAMEGAVNAAAQVGYWDVAARSFSPDVGCSASVNSVRVVSSRQSAGLFMSLLGVAAPLVQADAMAYVCPTAGAPPTCPPGAGGGSTRPILVR